MNFFALGLALAIVIASALFGPKEEVLPIQKENVLSATMAPLPSPVVTVKPEPTEKPFSPTPVSAPAADIFQFQYPGSSLVTATNSTLTLNSSDSSRQITDWYKEKIRAKGYNAQSFVVTQANDEILNSLTAAGKDSKVSVVISQKSGESAVKITVNLEAIDKIDKTI